MLRNVLDESSAEGDESAAAAEPFLTTPEFAKLARTEPGTVRYWRHIGYGPQGAKVGRRVLYRRADVEQWLNDQFKPAGPTATKRATRSA